VRIDVLERSYRQLSESKSQRAFFRVFPRLSRLRAVNAQATQPAQLLPPLSAVLRVFLIGTVLALVFSRHELGLEPSTARYRAEHMNHAET